MKINDTTSVIFDDFTYLTSSEFFKKIAKASSFLKKNDSSHEVFIIQIDDPISALIMLFAVWNVKKIAALHNPKLLPSIRQQLLEDLGPHTVIDRLYEDDEVLNIDFNYEKISLLLATSGSLKGPKWIASSISNWIQSAKGNIIHLQAKSFEPWIVNLPLFHASGLAIVFRAFLSNAPLVLSRKLEDVNLARYSFVPKQIQVFEKNNMLAKFLKASSILIGGAKIDHYTFKILQNYPFYLTYGMTECCSSISISDKNPSKIEEGYVLINRQVHIDEAGKIYLKGSASCDYRWHKGTLIALKTHDGFYPTGDDGIMSHNIIQILGRNDERIEINGEKIYPSQIEESLQKIFPFHQIIVTHVIDELKQVHICAFSSPVPNLQEVTLLKKTVGSLFFPKYFFKLKEYKSDQKIILQELKKEALEFIRDITLQNA